MFRTLPFLMSFVVAIVIQLRRAAGPASNASRYESKPNPAMTPVATPEMTLVCRNSSRACGFEMCTSIEREARLRHERRRIAQRVAVVRERRRIEDDGLARVDRLVQPADQLGLVVGLPQVDLVVGRPLGEQHAQRREVCVP